MLKYLFEVQFDDGTSYIQNPDDRSVIDPEKRSCFYDVLQSGKKIVAFHLSDKTDWYSVYLTDGHFEVNGKGFFMHEERNFTDFKLIFFRQHTHHFNRATMEQFAHEIVYRMGWQANNIQRVMEIY